jgi:hypothetical protein
LHNLHDEQETSKGGVCSAFGLIGALVPPELNGGVISTALWDEQLFRMDRSAALFIVSFLFKKCICSLIFDSLLWVVHTKHIDDSEDVCFKSAKYRSDFSKHETLYSTPITTMICDVSTSPASRRNAKCNGMCPLSG